MPTYEYKCLSCNNIFEMFQSMTSEHVKTCPSCGGQVKRLIGTGSGPIFKGKGFYQTDYKNKTSGSSSLSDTKGSSTGKEDIKSDGEGKKKESKSSDKESKKGSDV